MSNLATGRPRAGKKKNLVRPAESPLPTPVRPAVPVRPTSLTEIESVLATNAGDPVLGLLCALAALNNNHLDLQEARLRYGWSPAVYMALTASARMYRARGHLAAQEDTNIVSVRGI